MVDDDSGAPETVFIAGRRRTSRRGVAWCGSNRAGHVIPPGVTYQETVYLNDGDFCVDRMCFDCEGDLLGYEGMTVHRLTERPA